MRKSRHEREAAGRLSRFRCFCRDPWGGDGLLFYNSFGKWPQRRQRREIADIITHLTSPGRIPPDGVVIGWPGIGLKPVNAVDTSDAELMAPWFARAFTVFVRVGPSGEATMTLDGPRSRRASGVCFSTRKDAIHGGDREARRHRSRG